jgi:tetratricopeptide (TPR) repeat protein
LAASLVLLALLAGIVGTTVGLLEAQRQERRAVIESKEKENARQSEALQRRQAEKRLSQVEKANEILGSIFKDLDPHNAEKEGKPLSALLGERLDQATAQIEGEAIGDRLAVARMQQTLGECQLGLGFYEMAVGLFAKARATFTARLGPDHSETLASMNNLARGYQAVGRLDQALPLFEETVALMKSKVGPDDPNTLNTMNNLADAYWVVSKPDRALPLLRELADLWKGKAGADSPQYVGALSTLSQNLLQQEKWPEAETVLRQVLTIREAKAPDAWSTFSEKSMLGGALLGQKQYAAAEPLLRAGYEGMKQRATRIPTQSKPRLAEALDRLIALAEATNKPDEAKTWKEERTKLPPASTSKPAASGDLGSPADNDGLNFSRFIETSRLWFAPIWETRPRRLPKWPSTRAA